MHNVSQSIMVASNERAWYFTATQSLGLLPLTSSCGVGWSRVGEVGGPRDPLAPSGKSFRHVCRQRPSPAGMHLHHFAALFAFDITAPVELTAASVHHLHLLRLKATAAAHQLTAVNGFGGSVTLAAHCAQHARRAWVKVAEVRARVQVDQIFICVRFELGVTGHQDFGGAHLALLHLSGPVELLFNDVAHLAEWRHGFPAGLDFAGARHAVTFTLHAHVGQDGLQR